MGKDSLPPPAPTTLEPPGKRRYAMSVSAVLSGLVLLMALTATYLLWQEAQRDNGRLLQTQFEHLVQDTNQRLELRMLTYEQVLRGAVGLFSASGYVTREEFHAYYESLQLGKNYPGIQGVGFAAFIPAEQKDQHVAEVRAQGFPGYVIYPPEERDVYTSIIYLEPFSGRNIRAFGYDMYTHPVRREAMDRARDTGETAISGKVTLVQEIGQDIQAGFLMYLPVYRPATLNRTVEERRANLIGWVYAPFRMRDLMMGFNAGQYVDIDVAIYDGLEVNDAALLYEGRRNLAANAASLPFVETRSIQIANHAWTVIAAAPPHFGRHAANDRATITLKAGVAMSLLLALLTWLLVDERARAWRAADYAYRLALYDPLTQLPNRKLFHDRLHRALAQAKREQRRIAIMFIDLDRFKPINDNFGHEIGDLLLVQVAEHLVSCVRESDTVARLGGDEFVILLTSSEQESGVGIVADKILNSLNEPFYISGHQLSLSSSIGIAFYPEHGRDENQLLRHADIAMYHAKQGGRNCYRYYEGELSEEQT